MTMLDPAISDFHKNTYEVLSACPEAICKIINVDTGNVHN